MTYAPVAADVGNTLKVTVSFTDGAGSAEMVTSDPTAAVAEEDNNPATGQPTISGTPQVGETLTADASGIDDADGLGTFAYQWISNNGTADSDISGATSTTYDPVAADVGNTLKVTVSFTDGEGFAEMVTSDPTAAVAEEDAPGLVISVEELDVGEGEDETYTVRLATEPESPVTVTITGAETPVDD